MISSFDIINLQFAQAEFHDTIKDDNFDKKYSQSLSFGIIEAATRDILCKKVFLEISQNSQENIYFI